MNNKAWTIPKLEGFLPRQKAPGGRKDAVRKRIWGMAGLLEKEEAACSHDEKRPRMASTELAHCAHNFVVTPFHPISRPDALYKALVKAGMPDRRMSMELVVLSRARLNPDDGEAARGNVSLPSPEPESGRVSITKTAAVESAPRGFPAPESPVASNVARRIPAWEKIGAKSNAVPSTDLMTETPCRLMT